jgi:hypothetical protein
MNGYRILKECNPAFCATTISLCLFKERHVIMVVPKMLIGIKKVMLSVIFKKAK